jgi:DNA processing protein
MITHWIALNSVRGLGPVRIKHLIERHATPEAVLNESPERIARTAGVPYAVAAQLASPALMEHAERQLDAARDGGAEVVALDDGRYPLLLKEIFAPPPVLFVKGALDVFSLNALGVVGTRAPTQYGRRAAATIVRELVAANLTVVSGLALGIDSVAHEACLEAGGRTVAVLGCGIDRVYPGSNRGLTERIMDRGGALVSEFPMSLEPLKFNFPRRNRIISGLSAGVLVVEAGRKSGSLITASYALQQGRDVFAVPGSIFSDKSIGTHGLLRSGATPVRSAAEILDAIQVLTSLPAQPGNTAAAFPAQLLNEEECVVLSAIGDSPLRFDQLAESTGTAVTDLFDILLNLELKGAIKQLAGQQFVRM